MEVSPVGWTRQVARMIFTDLVEEMANEIARLWSVRETQPRGAQHRGFSMVFPTVYLSIHGNPRFLHF